MNDLSIFQGLQVVLHYQSLCEQATVRKLISQLQKNSDQVIKKKPRCLFKNSQGVIEMEVNRPICIELYKEFKDLGRFMIRSGGTTIAAGFVTKVIASFSLIRINDYHFYSRFCN